MLTEFAAAGLAVVPGGILGFAVAPGRTRWLVFSAAPILSLGLTAIAMSWVHAVGLPGNVIAVLVGGLVVAVAAVMLAWLPDRARSWWNVRLGAPSRADAIGVAVPALLAAAFGVAFFRRFTQPPGWDAMYHGMLAREMLAKGTTSVSSVCTTGSVASSTSCHFYPLAADTSWAQAAKISGGRIGSAMLAWEAVIGPVALVVAVYALVRLLGGRTLVAASAATATLVLGPLWMSTLTGRITQEVAPGLAVSIVVLVTAALRTRQYLRVGLLAGCAMAGLLLTHSYEVAFAVVLALVIVAMSVRPFVVRRVVAVFALAVVAAFVAVAPMLSSVLDAGNERSQVKATMPGDYFGAARFWVTDLQRYVLYAFPSPSTRHFDFSHWAIQAGLWVTVPCLLASPFCLVVRELRWARPWFVTWAIWTAVGIWTAASNSGAALLVSGLWYGVQERLHSMILPVYGVVVVAGAYVIGFAIRYLIARMHSGGRLMMLPAVTAAVVVAALVALSVTSSARRPIASDMSRRTPHGDSYARAFGWLATHITRGKVAAYDQNLEMITWSYVDDSVPYLFGLPPLSPKIGPDYAQRWLAWDWLVNNPGATPAGCQVSRFGVEYVVVGGARIPNFKVDYSRSLLAHSPRVDLVHQDGSIKIYKVNATGSACSST